MATNFDGLISALQQSLGTLKAANSADDHWKLVEAACKGIADGLRTRNNGPVDNHTQLGRSDLPEVLTGLLGQATNVRSADGGIKSGIPASPASAAATYEILRVGANLCMDHDPNRQRLLEVGYTDAVLGILKAYWRTVGQPAERGEAPTPADNVTLSDLKLVKTSVGVLLNASMGYEPVRSKLLSAGAPLLILCLSSRLYSPCSWESAMSEDAQEQWKWRSGLSAWSWRALDTLQGVDTEGDGHEDGAPERFRNLVLDARAVPSLVSSFRGFVPPHAPRAPDAIAPKARQELVISDLEVLEEASMLLESLALDSEEVRKTIAMATLYSPTPTATSPFPPPPLLTSILDFVEKGCPPPYWGECSDSETERKRWHKSFGLCKAAVIKAVVTIAGEDKNLDVLWDSQVGSYPGGPFVERMVGWIKNTKVEGEDAGDGGRDDLIICATLSLGNLARRPSHCIALLASPVSLTPHLLPLLKPQTNIKLKHGCLGLLKHLAQPPPNKTVLGDAGLINALSDSRVWTREWDIAEPVQLGAIGVAKHLSYEHLVNSLRLGSSYASNPDSDSGLDLILDLVRRSDSIALQSEGTRVLVNVIKCLFSASSSSTSSSTASASSTATRKPNGPGSLPPLDTNVNVRRGSLPMSRSGSLDEQLQQQRQQVVQRITTIDSAELLTEMIGRSGRYTILLNEGIVSLTLMSSIAAGRTCVIQALLAPLPYQLNDAGAIQAAPSNGHQSTKQPGQDTTPTLDGQPGPSRPLDMLLIMLRNIHGTFPPELGANSCALLTALTGTDSQAAKVKQASKGVLESVAAGQLGGKGSEEPPKLVREAARRCLNVWVATEGSPARTQ